LHTMITKINLYSNESDTIASFKANEIRKNRYLFEFQNREFSVDMFLGDLFGLVLAEVSFETDEEMDNFPPPPFAVADVTNNEIFTGGRLSELNFEEIRAEIEKSGLLGRFASKSDGNEIIRATGEPHE